MGPEDGNFAIWVGTLVSNDSTYLVVTASGKDGETLQRMARIGYTKVRRSTCCCILFTFKNFFANNTILHYC